MSADIQQERAPLADVQDANRVVGVLARLRPDSVVRLLAMQVIQGRPLETIQPLYSALETTNVRQWRDRYVAAWALGRAKLHGTDRATVVDRLREVVEGVHRESWLSRFGRGALWTVGVVFSLLAYIMLRVGPPASGDDFFVFLFAAHLIFGAIAVPLTFLHARQSNGHVRAAAANSLAHLDAVEAVGTLARALLDDNCEVSDSAAHALHYLLPLVTEEQYGVLGARSSENLGRALSHKDGRLVLKILEALEKAGSSAAIPYVARAAQRGSTVVADAASRVLAVLRDRQTRETDRDRLLRPSRGANDPDLLLRAPEASSTEDTALLLQPSDGA